MSTPRRDSRLHFCEQGDSPNTTCGLPVKEKGMRLVFWDLRLWNAWSHMRQCCNCIAALRNLDLIHGAKPPGGDESFVLDLDRASEIVHELGFDGINEQMPLIFDGQLGDAEFMTHEIGHALSMGIEIKIGFGVEIHKSPRVGASNEALVLVAQEHLFRWIGNPIDPSDIENCAEVQQVTRELLTETRGSFEPVFLARQLFTWLQSRGAITDQRT